MNRYRTVDGTVWPVDIPDEDGTTVAWRLRYGVPLSPEDRMLAASILEAYASLTLSVRTQRDAVSMLRRARHARRNALEAAAGESGDTA